MFIIEVVVGGGGGVLEWIILNGVPTVLSTTLTYTRGAKYHKHIFNIKLWNGRINNYNEDNSRLIKTAVQGVIKEMCMNVKIWVFVVFMKWAVWGVFWAADQTLKKTKGSDNLWFVIICDILQTEPLIKKDNSLISSDQ